MIEKREDGWYVFSLNGRKLGGPYPDETMAKARLEQVEYFKNKRPPKRSVFNPQVPKGKDYHKC